MNANQYGALLGGNALIALGGGALALAIVLRLRFLILERELLTLPLPVLFIGAGLLSALAVAPFALLWHRRTDLFPALGAVYRLPLENKYARRARNDGPLIYYAVFAGLGSFRIPEALFNQLRHDATYEILISPKHHRLWEAREI